MIRLFTETFEKTLDSQLRLALPSQWRTEDGAGDRFVVLMLPGSLLRMIPYDLFEESVLGRAGDFSLADMNAFEEMAVLGSRMRDCPCDRQGRIQLSPSLAEHSGLKDRVILIGAVRSVMIASPETWKGMNHDDDERDLMMLDRLHGKGKA